MLRLNCTESSNTVQLSFLIHLINVHKAIYCVTFGSSTPMDKLLSPLKPHSHCGRNRATPLEGPSVRHRPASCIWDLRFARAYYHLHGLHADRTRRSASSFAERYVRQHRPFRRHSKGAMCRPHSLPAPTADRVLSISRVRQISTRVFPSGIKRETVDGRLTTGYLNVASDRRRIPDRMERLGLHS